MGAGIFPVMAARAYMQNLAGFSGASGYVLVARYLLLIYRDYS